MLRGARATSIVDEDVAPPDHSFSQTSTTWFMLGAGRIDNPTHDYVPRQIRHIIDNIWTVALSIEQVSSFICMKKVSTSDPSSCRKSGMKV